MKDFRKTVVIALVPLAGAAVLAGALYLRHREASPSPIRPAPSATRTEASTRSWTGDAPLTIAQPAHRPAAAPEKTVAERSEVVRIRSTYQNYRTAVATKNTTLEQAIRPALLRDRETSLALAQEDLAQAKSEFDRDVARKVIEAMRR